MTLVLQHCVNFVNTVNLLRIPSIGKLKSWYYFTNKKLQSKLLQTIPVRGKTGNLRKGSPWISAPKIHCYAPLYGLYLVSALNNAVFGRDGQEHRTVAKLTVYELRLFFPRTAKPCFVIWLLILKLSHQNLCVQVNYFLCVRNTASVLIIQQQSMYICGFGTVHGLVSRVGHKLNLSGSFHGETIM